MARMTKRLISIEAGQTLHLFDLVILIVFGLVYDCLVIPAWSFDMAFI